MRRHFSGLALSLLLMGVGAMPAWACINDREVEPKEREFKSQYQDNRQRTNPVQETPTTEQKLLPYAALGAGSFLLAGAVVVCMRKV